MKKLLILIFPFLTTIVAAQIIGPDVSRFNSIRQNGVSSIVATGDTVWISPSLNRNIGNGADWFKPTGIDSIDNGIGRVFSVEANGDTLFAGLGFTSETSVGNQPAGYGYYITTDGGDSWRFSDFLLDRFVNEDTSFTYGGVLYNRQRIIVPEQSPPYDISFKGEVLFSANWASGLLRSADFGNSWERVVLPPFGERLLTPERNDYYWRDCIAIQNGSCTAEQNLYNSVEDDNLKGFAVHIDSQNRVWYGSAGGINISENALSAPLDSISWKNVGFSGVSDGLLSRWIIEIEEDTATGRVWMTNWTAETNGGDKFGIVYTEDSGDTFEQRLVGEKILSIDFKDGYIFAAGENGLFISPDGGDSWQKSPQIRSANTFLKESAEFQSVAVASDRIWVGTNDGLISTNDFGQTWEITRVNFPLSGGNAFDPEAKTVSAYAYPNPFSPDQHEIVRIKFEVKNAGDVTVKVFDFGMNLVRELDNSQLSPGVYEALWDGIDGKGRKVANAPYFYVIETPNGNINGKILLVE